MLIWKLLMNIFVGWTSVIQLRRDIQLLSYRLLVVDYLL